VTSGVSAGDSLASARFEAMQGLFSGEQTTVMTKIGSNARTGASRSCGRKRKALGIIPVFFKVKEWETGCSYLISVENQHLYSEE